MSPEMLQLIGVAITAILGTWGAMYVASRGERSANQGTVAEFAKGVVERVETLEGRVLALEEHIKIQDQVIRRFGTFVDRIGLWIAGGGKGSKPAPPDGIHEYIDHTLWGSPPKEEER